MSEEGGADVPHFTMYTMYPSLFGTDVGQGGSDPSRKSVY
jgi:hypothetical protein